MARVILELEHAIGLSVGVPGSICVCADNEHYVAAAGGCLSVNNLRDSNDQQFLRGHTNTISALAISPATKSLLASGQSGDADVIVWNLFNGESLWRFEEHDVGIAAVAFSPDERLLLSVGLDNAMFVWDLATGKIVSKVRLDANLAMCTAFAGHLASRSTGAVSGIYQFATAGHSAITVHGLNPITGVTASERISLPGLSRDYLCMSFGPSGLWLYLGTTSGEMALVQTAARSLFHLASISSSGVTSVTTQSVRPGVTEVIAGCGDGTVTIYSHDWGSVDKELAAVGGVLSAKSALAVKSFVCRATIQLAGGISSVAALGVSTVFTFELLAASTAGTLYRLGATLSTIAKKDRESIGVFPGAAARSTRAPEGGMMSSLVLAEAHGATSMQSVTSAAGAPALLPPGVAPAMVRVGGVADVSFTDRVNENFITCGQDDTIRMWDTNDYSCVSVANVTNGGHPNAVVFDVDWYISGWQDGGIRVFARAPSPKAGVKESQARAHPLWHIPTSHGAAREVTTLALLESHVSFVTGDNHGLIRVWDAHTQSLRSSLKHHAGAVTQLLPLRDKKQLVSSSNDRSFALWDWTSGRLVSTHEQRLGGIKAVAVGPTAELVITGGGDHALTLWDLRRSQPVQQIPTAHAGADIMAVTTAAVTGIFMSGGADGSFKLWDLRNMAPISEYYGHVGAINRIAVSPDEKQAVTVGNDGLVLVWNLYPELL